ncbi:MAG: hypothetical protein LC660_09390, partial [Desulfobacteraceae bacterium]|nr:hypothetical protein [Desulfobacteraceae bacterium]
FMEIFHLFFWYVVPRIYSSYLKSLTNLQPSIIVVRIMETMIFTMLVCILLLSRDRNLHLENLALRQQLAIMKQKNKRTKIRIRDRIFWVFLSRFWKDWKGVLIVVPISRTCSRMKAVSLDREAGSE